MPNKNRRLYNDGQRHFVLAGVFVDGDNDEAFLLDKYRNFKEKFGFVDEIKGSDLMTRQNNKALEHFIEEIIDDKHFFICNYDKIFYLSTLISVYIFGRAFQEQETLMFYQYASALAGEDEKLFLQYCFAVQKNTDRSKEDFLRYLISFPFVKLSTNDCNLYIAFAKRMLAQKEYGEFPLVYEAYSCKSTVNFVNMTALGEILLCLKYQDNIDINNTIIFHDRLSDYEDEYNQSFENSNIYINFVDSKENELIQLADNVGSIYRKCFEKSKMINCIGMSHIKMVTQIADWVLPFVIRDIFGIKHNSYQQNKNKFWDLFLIYKEHILDEISGMKVDIPL